MKLSKVAGYFIVLFIILNGCLAAQENCDPAKLTITPAMIVNESRKGNAEALFDEQTVAGDPANKKGGNPTTLWYPGWGKNDHPGSIYINLGNPAKISSIYLRDVNNKGAFKVEAGLPGKWIPVLMDSMQGYQTWNEHKTNVTTQNLRLTRAQDDANV